MTIARSQHPLLVGRAREVESVENLRRTAEGCFVSVNVVGEAGVGRTRLLAELAERASQSGDIVVGAGPHDSAAPVAYHPIRLLLQALLNGDDTAISMLAEREARDQPLVAAGLREVITPTGVLGAAHESKVGAVACALAHCIHKTQLRASGKRIVLVVDDLHRCDGLSPRVLSELPRYTGGDSVLLLTAGSKAKPVPLPDDTSVIQLRGFTMLEAKAFTTGTSVPDDQEPEAGDRLLVPLYLEQLQGLGLAVDGRQTLPPRLADAVAQRIQRLNVSTRRLLQAIAVLGRSANRSSVEYVAERETMASLPQLLARGMVVETSGSLEIIHPLVRDLVEASTPAEARKALHLRALELATRIDAPLEVRAHHAYGSGETLSALVLLERLGDVSAARGDVDTAVLGYQRGIELARREVLESGDTTLDDVLASLGRRLGVLLARRGDVAGAEGVLREALEHSSATGPQRAPILVALARVVSERNREREAYRLLGQALELAYRDDAVLAQADVQVALAELRRKDNNVKSAISALKAVVELLTEQGADAGRCASVYLELAEAQLEDHDWSSAELTLQKASSHLEESGLPYARARALGLRARVHVGRNDASRALTLYREAAVLAAFAGAAELVRALEQAAHPISAGGAGRRGEDPARNAVS